MMIANIFDDTPLHGLVSWTVALYILVVPFLPWAAGRRRGRAGVLLSSSIAFFVLVLMTLALFLQCQIGYCGHGAMALGAVVMADLVTAFVTAASAVLAYCVWRDGAVR